LLVGRRRTCLRRRFNGASTARRLLCRRRGCRDEYRRRRDAAMARGCGGVERFVMAMLMLMLMPMVMLMLMRRAALGRLLSCCRNRRRRLARSSAEGADKSPLAWRLFMLASRDASVRHTSTTETATEAALRGREREETGASEVCENRHGRALALCIYVCSPSGYGALPCHGLWLWLWLPRPGASRISSHQNSRVSHFPAATRENWSS